MGDEVRRRRVEAGLSQEALARRSQVSVSSVIRMERGDTPRLHTLNAVAAALGVTSSELLNPPQAAIA